MASLSGSTLEPFGTHASAVKMSSANVRPAQASLFARAAQHMPGTLSILGTGAKVAGGIAGSLASARLLGAQSANLEQQAQISEAAGQMDIRLFRRAAQFRRGAIVAAGAKSGVRVDSGSAYEVLLAQARADGSEILQIQNARALEAWNLRAQAEMNRFQRRSIKRSMPLQITSAVAQGYANYAAVTA